MPNPPTYPAAKARLFSHCVYHRHRHKDLLCSSWLRRSACQRTDGRGRRAKSLRFGREGGVIAKSSERANERTDRRLIRHRQSGGRPRDRSTSGVSSFSDPRVRQMQHQHMHGTIVSGKYLHVHSLDLTLAFCLSLEILRSHLNRLAARNGRGRLPLSRFLLLS